MKQKIALALIVIFSAVFLFSGRKARADFGDYSNYDSGSNWSSSDWDSGSNWSSSDWDSGSNWSSSDWDSSSDSGGSSFGEFVLVIIIIVIAVIYFKFKNHGTPSASSSVSAPVRQNVTVPQNRTDELTAIIQQTDSAFSSTDFLAFVKSTFVQIQNAWSNQDLRPVAGLLHENLYQMTATQIERKKADGVVNHLERISVSQAYLIEFTSDERYENLFVYICAKMIDYQVRTATGELLCGNKTVPYTYHYKLRFTRTTGTKTVNTGFNPDEALHCPSCGAVVKGTAFGVCEYCGSTVTNNRYTWVLEDLSPIK